MRNIRVPIMVHDNTSSYGSIFSETAIQQIMEDLPGVEVLYKAKTVGTVKIAMRDGDGLFCMVEVNDSVPEDNMVGGPYGEVLAMKHGKTIIDFKLDALALMTDCSAKENKAVDKTTKET